MSLRLPDEDEEYEYEDEERTNVEIVHDLMSYGSPLRQVIVVTAIEKYCELCIDEGPEAFDTPLMSGKAWISACVDILHELKEAYGREE